MSWTFWRPDVPTGVTGSLSADGSLATGTTYYFKIVAWDDGSTSSNRYDSTYNKTPVASAYSNTFSITTDDTNKTVDLSWGEVKKRNDTTQVNGYEVLMSTSDNFDFADDSIDLVPSQYGYSRVCATGTFTSVTTTPGLRWHNLKSGLPLLEFNGDEETTFGSLYNTLVESGWDFFGRKLTNFTDSGTYGYQFLGAIEIDQNYAGSSVDGVYTLESQNESIYVFGGLKVSSIKYKLYNSIFQIQTKTHFYGSSFFASPAADSICYNTVLKGTIGNYGEIFWGEKSWGVATQMHSNILSYQSENVALRNTMLIGVDNTVISTTINDSVGFIATKDGNGSLAGFRKSDAFKFGVLEDGNPPQFYLTEVRQYGGYYNNTDCWKQRYNSPQVYFQMGTSSFLDCVWEYKNNDYFSDGKKWDFLLLNSTSRKWSAHSAFGFFKTIKVNVKDNDGNPIPYAQVIFSGNNGTNLTRGSSSSTVLTAYPYRASTTYNYDENEITFTHYDTGILIERYSTSYSFPETGQTYWWETEKITFEEEVAGSWPTNNKKYKVIRGVNNTVTGWCLSNAYEHLFSSSLDTAPDYHVADANGGVMNVTLCTAYHLNQYFTSYTGLSSAVAAGTIREYDFCPITIQISASGKATQTYKVYQDYCIDQGIFPIRIDAIMDNQMRCITLGGTQPILNLKPTYKLANNKNSWQKL